ncbi:MAG TPA: hypothetical protein VKN99_01755 [Polyangia bacterium]|nr:hypothetical protein [Polyangia bacterium]
MGLEIVVPRPNPPALPLLLERLAAAGLPSMIVMIDGALAAPGAGAPAVSADWRDLRLRTPAGTATLLRRPDGVAVVVFGNADAQLQAAQRTIAETLAALP